MIQARHLTKKFGDHIAVNNISLTQDEGTIFGLLGPNAAGKTTLLRMLSGIINSDKGEITINDLKVDQAKSIFGYVAQHFGQYEELTVLENLRFYARMYGVTDEKWLSSLLERFDLAPFRNHYAGTLSGGYQRRLALVCALSHDPKVLFLDEPTAGIDPVTRKLLWDEFYRLSTQGKTLFVTTHYMEEAQRCHQLAFLSSGRLVAEGSPDNIKKTLGEVIVYAGKIPYHPKLRQALLEITGIKLVNQFGNELRIMVKPGISQAQLKSLINSITGNDHAIYPCEPSLEDVFIALTQENRSME